MSTAPPGPPVGPQPVPLPGVGTFGQRFPGDRPAPVFDRSFKFAPVGLGRKLAALLLDAVVYGVVLALAELPAFLWRAPSTMFLVLAVGLLVLVFQVWYLGRRGFTPGMRMLRMRVVRHPEGTPIGIGNALVRLIVLGAPASITLGLWYVAIAWSTTRDPLHLKRGWHDLAAGSAVTDLRADAPGRRELEQRLAGERQRAEWSAAASQQAASAAAPPAAYPGPAPAQQPAAPLAPAAQQSPAPEPLAPAAFAVPGDVVIDEGTRVAPPRRTGWALSFDDGQVVRIAGLGLVGRDPQPRPGEDVRHRVAMADPGRSLSKTHASFAPGPDGALVLVDRHSTNGVSVLRAGEETELTAGTPFRLEAGDRVALGDRQMTVHQG